LNPAGSALSWARAVAAAATSEIAVRALAIETTCLGVMTDILPSSEGASMLTDLIGAADTTQDFSTSRRQLARGS
jgi:hypothetical protein